MNIRIYFRNYIAFFSIVYVSSITIKKESHFHNKWLVVNLTCLDETGGEGEENLRHFHKRSVSSSSDVLKGNDVVSSHGNDQLFKKVSSKKVGDEFSVVNESSTAAYEASNATNLSSSAVNESSSTVNESFNTVNESSIAVNESSITSNESFNAANDSAAILNNESYHSSVNDNDIARTSIIVNCNSFDLEPDLVPSSVKHLRIKSSGLIGLPSEWTRNLSNLSVLNINAESGLIFPSNDSCSWLPDSISTVDLTQTTLKTLSMSDCPTSLKKLYLQGTSLEELTLCLDYLEELDASWNLLKEGGIEKGCEDATKNLKALKLHNNEMTYWSPCGWPSLTHVELQKNEISRIDFNACVPNDIVEINLSNNKLKQQPHPLPSKLTSIKLSHNLIEESFHFPQTVQEIDMSHNALTHIGKGTFRSTFQLLFLDLSYNKLQVIYGHDFSGLRALRFLDLSHNAITHIRHEAFHPLRHILNLNINNNKLHHLDTRLFSNLPNNLQFRIHNNPWRCGCLLLADLSKASKYLCKPQCHEQPELTCFERDTEVLAQNILKQCLNAVPETDTKSPTHRRHQLAEKRNNSDEDTSEERKKSSSFSYYMIIPVVALFIGIPLIGLAIRTLYLNRKNMKQCCNCIANSPNVRWTPQRNVERDSDSETEF